MPAILARGLSRRFGDIPAVTNLSLEVQPGEVFGFLGHNGAGKTTTIRLLNGVLAPSAGEARVLGLDPVTQGAALRRRTGVLTENPSLDERLSARENLTIYADLYGVPEGEVARRVAESLEMFELQTRDTEKVGTFSKGMKQRLALARALIHRPQVVYLDEPTSGLDPIAARGVRDLIRTLSREQGHTVFLCTHNLPEAQRLCDRVAVLEQGQLIALGTPAELGQQIMHSSQRVEIEVAHDDAGRALAVIQAVAGVREASVEVDVVIAQGTGRETVPLLLGALVEAGIRVYRVTPQEPTLEDIYFALHEGAPA